MPFEADLRRVLPTSALRPLKLARAQLRCSENSGSFRFGPNDRNAPILAVSSGDRLTRKWSFVQGRRV